MVSCQSSFTYIVQPPMSRRYPDAGWPVTGSDALNVGAVLEVRKKSGPGVAFIAG